MNPWETVKKVLSDKELTEDDESCPVTLFLRILSFDKKLLTEVDNLNYFYPLDGKQWFQLFRIVFGGCGNRWIDYLKKGKSNKDKVFEKFKERVKKLYCWSERELGSQLDVLIRYSDDRFLAGLGLDDKERVMLLKLFSSYNK